MHTKVFRHAAQRRPVASRRAVRRLGAGATPRGAAVILCALLMSLSFSPWAGPDGAASAEANLDRSGPTEGGAKTDRPGSRDLGGPDLQVEICTWYGGAAGAASISVDDSCSSCRSLLNQHGFKGTYYLSETDKFTEADWETWRSIYAEGHELGGHTTSHTSCHILDEKTLRWELSSNRTHILTHVGMPEEELTSFAWPRGDCSPASEAIASEYYLSARGYHINELEERDPADFTNLKSINTAHYHHPAYDPPDYLEVADQAEALGKWASYVFHNHCQDDGVIAYLATKDLWVAPVGAVVKYIKERQNSYVQRVTRTDSHISFTLMSRLNPRLFNQALTIKVFAQPSNVENILANGTSTPFTRGVDYILFDLVPSGRDEIQVTTRPTAPSSGPERPLAQGRQGAASNSPEKVVPGNGAVTNIWISGKTRLDNLRTRRVKYLFVDVGDTSRRGKIETPIAEIVEFLRLIQSYEKQHAYDFVLLPYSEINTYHYTLDSAFRTNFVADYKGLIALGFDGVYVDVEPVRRSLQEDYLELLNELSAACPKEAVLAVYAGSMSDSQLSDKRISDWQWSRELYRDVSDRVDLIAVPGYDFNLQSKAEYTASLRKQIGLVSAEPFNCHFMFTVPTHKREPETIDNALSAYRAAIKKHPHHQFVGVCVFAEWTTIPEEWNAFESGTRG